MPARADRFLGRRPVAPGRLALGRVFRVVQESWPLSADPKATPPVRAVVASDRSASDAADLARAAAEAFPRHGFHKPSRSWWGSDGEQFHRFAVRARGSRFSAVALGLGAAGVTLLTLLRRRKS